jgi:chemotaxis protein CheX
LIQSTVADVTASDEMHESLVIEGIQAAAAKVFSTMLDKTLTCEQAYDEDARGSSLLAVSAQISLVGARSITSLMLCSGPTACVIASAMLLEECPAVDAEVLDAVAEIANMIMGTMKTDMDAQLGTANLSIPTVTFGQDFAVYNNSKGWVVVPFSMDGAPFTVKLCFQRPSTSRARMD